MLIGLLLFGALAAPVPAPSATPVIRRDVMQSRLDIPDEIAPAVVPYMQCRLASSGVPMYTAGKKAVIAPPSGVSNGSDCSAIRAQAASNADKMLKRSGNKTAEQRAAFIDQTLTSIEAFSLPGAAVAPRQEPVSAVTLSPEARNKYEPYRRCLIEQAVLLASADGSDEAIVKQAGSKCLAANLSSGSAALFAEMKTGATKDEAIERVARLRQETEREALARARSLKSKGPIVVER